MYPLPPTRVPRPVTAAMLLLLTLAAAPRAAEPDLAAIYRECLLAFEPYAESVWHDAPAPPDSGYFGDGRSGGNGGIRGSVGIALAYAVLVRDNPEAPETGRRVQRIAAALRYAAGTHLTGSHACVDGKRWGNSWQSSLWVGSLGFAAALTEDRLPADLAAACRAVVDSEADHRAAIPPASGYRGDSKAEENAWNTNVLCLAAARAGDSPRRATWLTAAKAYMANTYTVPDPGDDPLADILETVTLYPSFACENHGFFHPSYQMVSGMSLGDSFLMAAILHPQTAAELRPYAEHNVIPAWECVLPMLLDSGDMAYPSGLDWSLHGYGQISYYAWLARHFANGEAAWAESQLARRLRFRQVCTGDGRFTGDSCPDGFYREAVMARRVAIALLHATVNRAATPIAPAPVVRHLPDVRLVTQRTDRGFVSLSYGKPVMLQVIPAAGEAETAQYLTSPRNPSLLGGGFAATALTCDTKVREIRADGFAADMLISAPFGTRIRAAVESAPGGLVLLEVPEAVGPVGSPGEVFPLGIENHELNGGVRTLTADDGTRTVAERSGVTVDLSGSWVCVDGRLGIVAGPDGSFRYRAAGSYNRRGAAEDTLAFVPKDLGAPRFVVVAPGADAEATRNMARSLRVTAVGGRFEVTVRLPDGRALTAEAPRPRTGPAAVGTVRVRAVEASSFSPDYPAEMACDGDPTTFWVSRREAPGPGTGPTPERPERLHFVFEREEAVASIVLLPREHYGPRRIRLELGETSVFEGAIPNAAWEIRPDPPVRAATATLTITDSHDPAHPEAPRNTQVAEVVFTVAPVAGPAVP